MDITVVHVSGCPHVTMAQRRLDHALGRLRLTAVVRQQLVTSVRDVAAHQFGGSPTILIDGHDPFPGPADQAGLACRLYPTDRGPQGAPSVAQIVEALRAHQRRSLEQQSRDQLA